MQTVFTAASALNVSRKGRKMKICKACDTEYSDELNSCPVCGSNKYYSAEELKEEEERQKKELQNHRRSVGKGPKLKYRIRQIAAILILLILISVPAYYINRNIQYNREIKQLYDIGVEFYEDGDIEDAIEYLLLVPTNSKYFNSAQEILEDCYARYIADIEKKVNLSLKENDFDTAMDIVNEALGVLPDEKMIDDLYNEVLSKYKSYVLSKAKQYADDNNYPDAIYLLEEAYEKSDFDVEIESLLSSYKNTYRDAVIKQARKMLDKEGYEKAMGYLSAARDVLRDDEKLNQAIEEFKQYQPVYLYEMEPYEVSQYAEIGNSWMELSKDNYGNQYIERSVLSPASIGFTTGTGHIRYNINKQYNVLEGTIYVPYESRNIKSSSNYLRSFGPTRIWIYGDGTKLYTADKLFETDKPYRFSVDVTGVEFLEIRLQGGWTKDDGTGLRPTMCAAELSVRKK